MNALKAIHDLYYFATLGFLLWFWGVAAARTSNSMLSRDKTQQNARVGEKTKQNTRLPRYYATKPCDRSTQMPSNKSAANNQDECGIAIYMILSS